MKVVKKALIILTMCLMMVIGSGCLSLFQPVNKIKREFTWIDMDAPAMRLAKPVNAELLEKIDGKWVSIGVGTIPAGAYIKGRAPKKTVE